MDGMTSWGMVMGLALVMSGVAVIATAASTVPSDAQRSRFAAWDSDGDGYLSPVEAQRVDGLAHAFAQVDMNHDGKVDVVEYAAFEEASEE